MKHAAPDAEAEGSGERVAPALRLSPNFQSSDADLELRSSE